MTTSADWGRLAGVYADRFGLMPPERELLRRLRGKLASIQMLDLGVGAGRTTEVFAPLVAGYVGLDYSPAMIERGRARVGRVDAGLLEVGDARDLSRWERGAFDLVLFSFNGIDYVDIADRERIMLEVRRVLADGGIFAFSTHSLHALPLSTRPRRPSRRDPVRSTIRSLRGSARLRRVNRALDLDTARVRGWARIRDGAHDFSIPATTYVDPGYQLRRLQPLGFVAEDVLDASGFSVSPGDPGPTPHLFFVCSPAQPSQSPAL